MRQAVDTPNAKNDFIRSIVAEHVETGKHNGRVVTRFPPEPNGYLHIGHAKSICLNFGIAQEHPQGRCHLRFDDTNPLKESTEYVEAIQRDVQWLGFDWGEHLYFASDYFETLYQAAVYLIKKGRAYVCDLDEEAIREYRGTLSEPGRPSPYRDRSVEESLDLFARMRAGEFEDGSRVLRGRIDMSDPNMLMRDPIFYRIRAAHHHRTGDDWCIYPMYDFAHCISDAIEQITHSICTLEFENNRELYDWILDELDDFIPEDGERPRQYEFARLNLAYTMMSKRKLLQLVEEGTVSGWDDPRMPTVAGMRRRGYTPEAIRAFAHMIGVSKANSMVDYQKLEFCIRDDLNTRAPRVMAVLDPLKVTITNWPEGEVRQIDAPSFPHDVGKPGTRQVPFSGTVYIERGDFQEVPEKKFFRLAPGREVRLRYACYVTCDEVVKDDDGNVVELRCSWAPDSWGGGTEDGRKVKATLHWVSAEHGRPAEIRLYERLFAVEQPGSERDALEDLNPDSLTVVQALVEPSVADDPAGTRYQFERKGYFISDAGESSADALVFNRIVGLRDTWAKVRAKPTAAPEEATDPVNDAEAGDDDGDDGGRVRPDKLTRAQVREKIRAETPELAARMTRYQEALGLDEESADLLTESVALAEFFEAGVEAWDDAQAVAKWVINEVLREIKDSPIEELPFGGGQLGRLVALVEEDTISATAASTVFAEMVESGGEPAEIVERRGLQQVDDPSRLNPVVAEVLGRFPAKVEEYRGGKKGLLGFFIGQVMRATGGKANPSLVRDLVSQRLDA